MLLFDYRIRRLRQQGRSLFEVFTTETHRKRVGVLHDREMDPAFSGISLASLSLLLNAFFLKDHLSLVLVVWDRQRIPLGQVDEYVGTIKSKQRSNVFSNVMMKTSRLKRLTV